MTSLVELKNTIEKLGKNYQIEILDYLQKIPRIKLNENENGIFINIGLLDKKEIEELRKKIETFEKIEHMLLHNNEEKMGGIEEANNNGG
jgi:hypothetical protein